VASSDQRAEVVRRGFEGFNAGDVNAVIGLLAEDVEVFSSPELANAGTFHGPDGFLEWIRPWAEAWDGLDMEVTATTPVGARHVVAEVHQTGQGREGIEVTMDVAFLFDINDEGMTSFLALLQNGEQAVELAREREG
jgi:ketosteroid isomerase-like protein